MNATPAAWRYRHVDAGLLQSCEARLPGRKIKAAIDMRSRRRGCVLMLIGDQVKQTSEQMLLKAVKERKFRLSVKKRRHDE